MLELSTYLHFEGNCEEVMNYYKGVFGGELELNRYGDTHMEGDKQMDGSKIMHATLTAPGLSFMASDAMSENLTWGNNFSMSIAGDAATEGGRIKGYYEALAKDGTITMPMNTVPWGAEFGMVKDKYNIDWMFNITTGHGA